jgi:hypothetical protein
LVGWSLDLGTQQDIVEPHHAIIQPHPQTQPRLPGQISLPAAPIVAQFLARWRLCFPRQLAAGTGAGVHQGTELFQRRVVAVRAIALPSEVAIGRQAEPLEIIPDGGFKLGACALPVVVLDAEPDCAAAQPRYPHTYTAFATCPRCRNPVGAGANRVTRGLGSRAILTASILIRMDRGTGFGVLPYVVAYC